MIGVSGLPLRGSVEHGPEGVRLTREKQVESSTIIQMRDKGDSTEEKWTDGGFRE